MGANKNIFIQLYDVKTLMCITFVADKLFVARGETHAGAEACSIPNALIRLACPVSFTNRKIITRVMFPVNVLSEIFIGVCAAEVSSSDIRMCIFLINIHE